MEGQPLYEPMEDFYDNGGEVEIYSAKELARLTSFEHIVKMANEVEEHLINGTPQRYVFQFADKDRPAEALWDENWNMVYIMRMTAFRMYCGEFLEQPHMLEAANQMLNMIHVEKEEKKEFEIRELNHLYELP